ncbi:hypothetical protein OQA88_12301 [Cercophora sp. LCS_1]
MSAAGHLSRARAGSNASGPERASRGRTGHMGDFAMPSSKSPPPASRFFDSCAATPSMFLYAQGNSVVCAHHDTLTIERRFARHSEEVQILAVDNVSDVGAGRLVVSYDAGQTAIVWDLMTGDEVSRFASYENLTCASWMRNGNVAFGNTQGNVILFEPTTSEHISARTIDQIAITALAPATDCRTFAIGYQNGSLLIATLQPRFTILHNLTTNRGPSPIVTLAWHASSSRQKSDMLAVQTNDGDLRVWSVAKAYNSDDPAKVVRLLKRTENYLAGPNWMGWSKNGRIIQYSEGETISWDVRTKHVTYDTIPTLPDVRGLALYGPGASLFTLGANNTVQQFDLNAPAMLVANVQHPANLLPPSPPISLEAEDKGHHASQSESENSVQIAIHADISESDEGYDERNMSPLGRMVRSDRDRESDYERYRTASPGSVQTRSSVSISSSTSQTQGRGGYPASVVSRGLTENTYISAGSSLRSGAQRPRHEGGLERQQSQRESFSTGSSISMGSSHYQRSKHKPSRLRNEIPRSPEDNKVTDLFKFTKSRLQDVPYKTPYTGGGHLTNDDLRRQMLSTIFGWNKEIEDLIRDELSRHPLGSTNRILLAKWLGDINTDIMAMGSENMTSSDWMLLALSGIGGQASQHKLGRAYVQRLLESGDVHAAATIMIGLGDHNDAIEIYISHKKYMEALILTCLFFPAVWERQEAIVRKWGEWAVQHGQQQLAIRCFACTGRESSDPWTSPSAHQITFPSISQTVPDLMSPPMSPPSLTHGPQRSIAKNASLKLITSFDKAPNKLLQNVDDGRTPLAAGITPIVESALDQDGEPATAVMRSARGQYGPASALPGGRNRLPSIGEAPDQHPRELLTAISKPAVDPYANVRPVETHQNTEQGRSLDMQRPHTSSPRLVKDKHPPPSPSPAAMQALMDGGRRRNGSRSRIPEGLDLSLPTLRDPMEDVTSPEPSAQSGVRYHWPSRRRGPASVASSVTSASAASSVAGRSTRSRRHHDHNQGKSLDDYLHSLDSAKSTANKYARATSRGRGRESSRDRDGRGRNESRGFTPKGGKRSPKSPVPMSPEDLINLATPKDDESFYTAPHEQDRGQLIDISFGEPEQPPTVKKATAYRDTRDSSRTGRDSSRPRDTSRVRASSRNNAGRTASRDGRRTHSPERTGLVDPRGRSATRERTGNHSPSSPQPMSTDGRYNYGSSDEDDYNRAVEAREKFRQRKGRSTSRNRNGEALMSPATSRSTSGWAAERSKGKKIAAPLTTPAPMQLVLNTGGDLRIKDDRAAKKEAAARELEERRRSLALRDASVPHPSTVSRRSPDAIGRGPSPPTLMALPSTTYVPFRKEDLPSRSATADPHSGRSTFSHRGGDNPKMGLPATPKAMRLVLESDGSKHNVPVPPMPAAYAQQPSPPIIHSNRSSPRKVPEPEPAANDGGLAMLLPSTVYTPPPSRQAMGSQIARSMSAPPRDLAPPTGTSTRHHFQKSSISSTGRRPSADSNANMIPPPPPPAPIPPMLKELQHLAIPPPPPPAPLPHAAGPKPVVYGGSTGMIEIVMDEDEKSTPAAVPVALPISENTVPVIAPPVPTASRNGHVRGRSSVDNSIAGRFSRATERMRSASRSRTGTRPDMQRIKSPEMMPPAPYESVPPPPTQLQMQQMQQMSYQMRAEMSKSTPPNQMQQQAALAAQAQGQGFVRDDFRTGLHRSEMI